MARLLFIVTIMAVILSACNPVITPTPEIINTPFLIETPLSSPTTTPLPATTTTLLPLQDIRGGQINVSCNNSLIDAATINTAIESSAMGDEIVISGQCLINESIVLLGDRSYRGTSTTGTILKQADGANLPALLVTDTYLENRDWTGTPVSIRQMTLDGNSEMNLQAKTDGIILRSWLSVVEYMKITDMSEDGIKVAYKSANGTDLTTGQVNGRISGNLIDRSGRYGVFVEFHVTDWNLVDNWIAFSGVDGLHLEDASGWVIERNHIYGIPHNAIYADHLWGTSISDNYIEGFGETEDMGEWYGIYATVQAGAASTIIGNRVFNVATNIPRNPTSTYRYIGLIFHDSSAISVTTNTVRGMGIVNETGLYYTSVGNDRGIVTSASNVVKDVQTERIILNGVTLINGY